MISSSAIATAANTVCSVIKNHPLGVQLVNTVWVIEQLFTVRVLLDLMKVLEPYQSFVQSITTACEATTDINNDNQSCKSSSVVNSSNLRIHHMGDVCTAYKEYFIAEQRQLHERQQQQQRAAEEERRRIEVKQKQMDALLLLRKQQQEHQQHLSGSMQSVTSALGVSVDNNLSTVILSVEENKHNNNDINGQQYVTTSVHTIDKTNDNNKRKADNDIVNNENISSNKYEPFVFEIPSLPTRLLNNYNNREGDPVASSTASRRPRKMKALKAVMERDISTSSSGSVINTEDRNVDEAVIYNNYSPATNVVARVTRRSPRVTATATTGLARAGRNSVVVREVMQCSEQESQQIVFHDSLP